MSRLVRLYPAAWRDRYETEFLGLLGERTPNVVERFDIVRGAVDAHLHPQVRRRTDPTPLPPVPDADLRVARRLGFAAVIGAVVWPAAFAVALMGPVVYDGHGAYRDGAAAFPILLLAVILLVGGLVGHLIRLPRDARLARVSALTAIPFLLMWGVGPWLWPVGLIAVGLIVALAVAGRHAGVWPLWAALVVVAAGVGVIAIGVVGATVAGTDRMAGGFVFLLIGLVLVPAWSASARRWSLGRVRAPKRADAR